MTPAACRAADVSRPFDPPRLMDDTSPAPRWDAFLAFSTRDAEIARRLHDRMQERGIRTFFSDRTISPGRDWQQDVVEALDTCRLVVALFSRHAAASPPFGSEVRRTVNRMREAPGSVRLLPVVLDDLPPNHAVFYAIDHLQQLRMDRGATLEGITASAASELDLVPRIDAVIERPEARWFSDAYRARFRVHGQRVEVRVERRARWVGSVLRLLVDGDRVWEMRVWNPWRRTAFEVPFRVGEAEGRLRLEARRGRATGEVTVAGERVLPIP